MNSIELITALVSRTDHDIDEFTGGAIIQTAINNRTLIKYKVSLYFGYENKKPLTRIIEIDRDVYFALPKALDDYLNNTVKCNDSNVFTMNKPTGRSTPTSTPTNTNTNTLNTNTLNTNTIKKKKFKKPTVTEVADYCKERKNTIDAETFVDYFESSGWIKANGQKVKDWKATIRTWEQRDKQKETQQPKIHYQT